MIPHPQESERDPTRPPSRLAAMLAPALVLLAAATGCSHHCGYIEQRAALVRAPEKDQITYLPGKGFFGPLKPVSRENHLLQVRVFRVGSGSQAFRREIWAREQYVKFVWYDPPLKVLSWVLFWRPFWEPFRDPHYHNGRNWDMLDYLRDVFAWFNIFEAFPNGRRTIGPEKLISAKPMFLKGDNLTDPEKSGRIALQHRGKTLLKRQVDDQGWAELDLLPVIRPQMADADLELALRYQPDRKVPPILKFIRIPRQVVAELLKKQRAAAGSPSKK